MAVRAAAGTGYLSKASAVTGAPYTWVGHFRSANASASITSLASISNSGATAFDYAEFVSTAIAIGTQSSYSATEDAVANNTWAPVAVTRTGNTRTIRTGRLSAVNSEAEAAGYDIIALLGHGAMGSQPARDIDGLKAWSVDLTPEEQAYETQQRAPVRTANLVHYAPLVAHTDLADAIAGGSWTNNGATLSTVDGPANLPEEWEGPRVASSATTADTTSAGGKSITLPSGIAAGDLLMAFAANDSSVSWSASAGWEKIDDGANGTAVQGACWARIATGSDALTITGEANDIAVVVGRIPAAQHSCTDVTTIVKGTAATGTSNAPNGPNCNPGTSGKYLWITYYAADDDDDTALWWPVEGAPVAQVKSATGTSSCQCGVAYRWLEASSYDPSAFALSASEEWRAQTFAIPPAVPLSAPTGLDAEGTSASEIEASWDTDVGDDSYDLRFRSTHTLPSVTTQDSGVPWHLDWISRLVPTPTGEYYYRYTGAGVRIYVMDSGVRATHEQLAGRVAAGANFTDGPDTDEDGHGTAAAGSAAASLIGSAKGAIVVPVKIWRAYEDPVNTTEYFDAYIDGLEWVLADAAGSGARCVITVSSWPPEGLDSGEEAQVAAAWQALHDAGVVCCSIARNEDAPVQNVAPYNMADVIVVSGLTDGSVFWGSYGPLVDIVAPAVDMPILLHTSDSGTGVSSGTSFGTPLTAGVCAMLLEENPHASPARIRELLIQQATPNVLIDVPANTVNLMLYSGATSTSWTTHSDVAEPYTIDGLEPESEYEVAVRRTVDAQTSDWSSGVLAETLAEPVEIECATGAAVAAGVTASVSSPITIACSVGHSIAAGLAAAITQPTTIACGTGQAAAHGAAAAVASPVTVACNAGQAVAAGLAAGVASPITIACAVGQAVAAGLAASVSSATTIQAGIGAAVASGPTAEIASPVTIACAVGQAEASGLQASISAGVVIACATGAATAAGLQSGVSSPVTIACETGAAAAAGLQAAVSSDAAILAQAGRAVAAGLPATVSSPKTIAAGVGHAEAAGLPASVTSGVVLQAGVGRAIASGLPAQISGSVTISAGVGQARASGLPAQIASPYTIPCGLGAAVALGLTANVSAATTIVCGVGVAIADGLRAAIGGDAFQIGIGESARVVASVVPRARVVASVVPRARVVASVVPRARVSLH